MVTPNKPVTRDMYIDEILVQWIDGQIKNGKFSTRDDVINYCIRNNMENEK